MWKVRWWRAYEGASGGLPHVTTRVMRALDRVPQGILAEVSETGRVNKAPRMFESAIEATARAGANIFVSSCVDYFNAQSELRKISIPRRPQGYSV